VLKASKRLLAIGCFCIGTNQVDLAAATELGIAVFNSPFSNSRSVAELIISQIINLSRKLGDSNREMHNGEWKKSTTGRREVRGKTLGIVGYGNIGTQLSILAETMGMHVIFFDTVVKLALGNSKAVTSLKTLLESADFVTLHVPQAEDTKGMIGPKEVAMMKKGSFLLNASRGNVVQIPAVAAAIKSGHLAGAYFDVFPVEPKVKTSTFDYEELKGLSNVLLTPHIGGATHEAQSAIGFEVAGKLLGFVNQGATDSAVNMPKINPVGNDDPDSHRIVNIHKNRPGVMKELNNILSEFNIRTQMLSTYKGVGYLICDVDREAGGEVKSMIKALDSNIKTRILF
jgi:D-3-phosphoglycerate dehydrogenase